MQKITTKKYAPLIRSVLIDDRENNRIDYALKQYEDLNPKKCHLDVGDYIFKGKNGIDVVFEYKLGEDFLSSITNEDNRLHNQVYEMVTNFDYTFVIVQVEDLMSLIDQHYFVSGQSISLPQVNGAISEYCTVSSVCFTQTQYQSFDLMLRIAGKLILNKPYSYKYGKKSTNSALNYLSAIKGLNSKAEVICRTLKLRCLNDLLKLQKEDLTTVNGIGDKMADKILNEINRGRYYDLSKDKEQTKLFE